MRVRAIAAYDGTAFYGFQRQGRERTVQGELERALDRIGGRASAVTCAGRTDTGVHASGQVIAFDIDWRHDMAALERALNVGLPEDVAVRGVAQCADAFSPRYDATSRVYEYTLYQARVRDPLRDRYAWHVAKALDLAVMNAAAAGLIGSHDFAAFGAATTESGITTRRMLRAEWVERTGKGSEIEYVLTVEANAFLYKMVRRIVNALVKAGLGRITAGAVAGALESADADRIKGIAPPCGLCLVEVKF
jgi:tRNA pseudouridine38-40 synthase